MANEKRLIDAKPLMQSGWHLVQTGESNRFIQSMSLADIPTVDAVEVVHGRWIETVWNERGVQKDCYGTPVPQYMCSVCAREEMIKEPYCHCGAKMDGGNEDG